MIALYRKELRSYFINPIGYLAVGLLFLVIGICAAIVNLHGGGYPMFEYAIGSSYAELILIILLPVLTMRTFAEERRQKTDRLLYTLPFSSLGIVCAKFFAVMTVLAIPTLLICLYPPVLSLYAEVNYAGAYSGILLFYLLMAALSAICIFLSSLTESQLISAVASGFTVLLIYLSDTLANVIPSTRIASVIGYLVLIAVVAGLIYRFSHDFTLSVISALILSAVLLVILLVNPTLFDGSFPTLIRSLALFRVMDEAIYGSLFDFTVIVLFLSVVAVFLFFTVRNVEKRRWN